MSTPNAAGARPDRFPTFRQAAGWLFSVRRLKLLVFGAACLATLVGLFYGVENWRGRRVWEKYKSALESIGERLDVTAVIPAPAPDNLNFAATPLMKPLLDYDGVTHVWRDTNASRRAYTFLSWIDGNLKVGPCVKERKSTSVRGRRISGPSPIVTIERQVRRAEQSGFRHRNCRKLPERPPGMCCPCSIN
jgi:hypothetical protein